MNTGTLLEGYENMETVLVTGSSRGIGLELTRQFLDLDYEVIATYRGKPSSSLSQLAGEHQYLRLIDLEVTHQDSILGLAKHLKGIKLDIIVNNAGISDPSDGDLDSLTAVDWANTLAVNTIAPLMVSRALLDNLRLSSNPRIITISSQMGSLNHQGTGRYAYRSSKAAANKVMQVLAQDLDDDKIIVCPIHPGWVQTDMGGTMADITVVQSATGIIDLIHHLTMEHSGRFFTWNGEEHQW